MKLAMYVASCETITTLQYLDMRLLQQKTPLKIQLMFSQLILRYGSVSLITLSQSHIKLKMNLLDNNTKLGNFAFDYRKKQQKFYLLYVRGLLQVKVKPVNLLMKMLQFPWRLTLLPRHQEQQLVSPTYLQAHLVNSLLHQPLLPLEQVRRQVVQGLDPTKSFPE